jgi:hypothetical protein
VEALEFSLAKTQRPQRPQRGFGTTDNTDNTDGERVLGYEGEKSEAGKLDI